MWRARKCIFFFHLEYQPLAANELQNGIILHVLYKLLTANKLGFSLGCSDKHLKLVVFLFGLAKSAMFPS